MAHGSNDGHTHDDGHAHGHDHHHAHGHDHYHAHGEPDGDAHGDGHAHGPGGAHAVTPTRAALARNAGLGKLLYLDAPSGIAGDMLVAALVDLGVPEAVVLDALAAVELSGYHVHFEVRVRSSIAATGFRVHLDAVQPARTYAQIRELLMTSRLALPVRDLALHAFAHLAAAEAKVHRMPLSDVHFHEVGAVDSIVDFVAAAACLDYLGASVLVSPLPQGRGYAQTQHGTIPLPAPAVLECLQGFATYDGGLPFEFVTPTGAAIVAAIAQSTSSYPHLTPTAIGWGAGSATLADRPNLLRAILGDSATSLPARDVSASAAPTHHEIACNLDDATGELVAHCIDIALQAGAVDAWATPITMKKGRPAVTLSALAPVALSQQVAACLLTETTSLGVRVLPVYRVERPRRSVQVATLYGTVPVKISEGPYGPPLVKPEFDVCKVHARAAGVPVREVIRAALAAYYST